jgi:hypothetical protein
MPKEITPPEKAKRKLTFAYKLHVLDLTARNIEPSLLLKWRQKNKYIKQLADTRFIHQYTKGVG